MTLKLTDATLQIIEHAFRLSPEALAKLNFAMSLTGSTHAVEALQTHCELGVDDAETLALALYLMSKIDYPETMISKSKKEKPVNPGQLSSTTLYIRNLPMNVTLEELTVAFENFGNIKEIRMQNDRITGDFYGTVFIEYVHASAAKLAQLQMDGKLWGINTVHVSFAKDKKAEAETINLGNNFLPLGNLLPTPERHSAFPLLSSPILPTHAQSSASIFISGLSTDSDLTTVRALFSRFGEILDARLLTDKLTGLPKGVAFVDFALQISADTAIDMMHNQIHNGRTLKVSRATTKTKTGSTALPILQSPLSRPPFQQSFSQFPQAFPSDQFLSYPNVGINPYY